MFRTFYQIPGEAKVWLAEEAVWTERSAVAREDSVHALADKDELSACLRFYGFPLGELAAPDDLVKQFEAAVTQRLNTFALEKGWDNIDRVLNQKGAFANEATVAQKVYDEIWLAAFALEAKIRFGTISVDGALAQLPETRWPPAHEA